MKLSLLFAFGVVAAAAAFASAQGVDLPEPIVSPEEVQEAIRAKVEMLYQTMDPKIYWELNLDAMGAEAKAREERYWGGRTALAVLALLYAGENPKSDRMQEILKWLAEIDMKATYITGIRAGVWSKLKDMKYRPLLIRDAQTLMESTKRSGKPSGYFTYMPSPTGGGDHSNTQYGVLGLREAAIRGVEIPREYWEAIQQHMIDTQAPNGGWGYPTSGAATNETAYGSMTVAGLANMYIALDRLGSYYEGPFNGESARFCGRAKQPEAIDKGLGWLDRNLAVDLGLKEGGDVQTRRAHGINLYYLYGLERCANASGRKNFGGLNWFQEGAKWILARGRGRDVCSLSWAILFLSKGDAPIFFNKLDTKADWNNDLLDIPNLSTYIGDQLEQRINWQVVDINDRVEEWLDAPVLFFNGHDIPKFTDEQKQKLRLYTDSGGTIVAEACCSKDDFTRGFKLLARQVWPEWELKMVDRTHPVLGVHHEIKERIPRTMHLFDGCRSRVFLVTDDMSCAWNQNILDRFHVHFQMGMNLARYASDRRTLRSRLYHTPNLFKELTAQGKAAPVPLAGERKIVVADWPTEGKRLTDIRAMRHLAETLKEGFNVTLETVTFNDNVLDKLDEVRIVHMSGHHSFVVSDENLAKLRAFVKKGGLIWADAQCGRDAFNESFETFVAKLLPGAKRAKVALEDALLTGEGLPLAGFDVRRIRYKYALKFNEFLPSLEEVHADGRRVLVYSPRDLTCGMDGHDCAGCRGPERNDALKMAANIVLSALTSGEAAAAEPGATPAPEGQPEQPRDDLPEFGHSRARQYGN